MHFDVLTIFPEMIAPLWAHGIVRRALEQGRISAATINIRDFAQGRHRVTDDRPYGGGAGMVMKPEPLAAAIRHCRRARPRTRTVLLTPQGRVLHQRMARQLAACPALTLVCARYEGLDERVSAHIDLEVSLGDYILTGGELAAMVVVDAVTRLLPGVLGGPDAADTESFETPRLEHAHYTRPAGFEGEAVPEVLVSGDHAAIERWRRENALLRTVLKRPDLLAEQPLERCEREWLMHWSERMRALAEP